MAVVLLACAVMLKTQLMCTVHAPRMWANHARQRVCHSVAQGVDVGAASRATHCPQVPRQPCANLSLLVQGSLGLPAPVPMGVGCFTKQDNWNALFYLDGPRLVDAGNQMCHLVVRPGDTFWGIAMSLKFTTEDLLKANPAVVPTQLQPGQVCS